jgi:hypothetical protein
MRTTVRLRAELLRQIKRRAAQENRTLTSVLEEGAALVLARPARKRRGHIRLLVSRASGGLMPGVDLNRSTELEALLEDA